MVLTKQERNHRYNVKHKEQLSIYHKKEYQQNRQEYLVRAAKERGLDFEILIPNPYENTSIRWVWHHIDDKFVVALPYNIHHAAQVNKKKGLTHHEQANAWVEIAYGICVKEIIGV